MSWVAKARPRKDVVDEAFRGALEAYEGAARKMWPGIDRAFREAIDDATLSRILTAFQAGGIPAIEDVVDWTTLGANLTGQMGPGMRAAFERGGELALKRMPGEVRVSPAFTGMTVLDPYAIRYMETNLPTLIREVTDATREAVRVAAMEAYKQGIGPAAAARTIRGSIGLTQKQAMAVANFRAGVIHAAQNDLGKDYLLDRWAASRDVIRNARQITLGNVNALADAYQRRLVMGRALLIARTEGVRAVAAGRDAFWNAAVTAGALDPKKHFKMWMTTPDERACPICLPLHRDIVPINGTFPGVGSHPPAHPACRCDVRVVEGKKVKKSEGDWIREQVRKHWHEEDEL